MAFRTYQQGLKIATDTAGQAISKESSLSSLSPLVSPLPTLQQTFPLYIASADAYSHLLSSGLVPAQERETVRKRWRLVLERAEKVRRRIESLGGHVGRIEAGDEAGEAAVLRRGGSINGVEIPEWPAQGLPDRLFQADAAGGRYREGKQPDMPNVEVEWSDIPASEWQAGPSGTSGKEERWTVRQGTGADCSVAAGLGVCIVHNRVWSSKLVSSSVHPYARPSENGKHVVKLLLNGAWRQVVVDSLLPRSRATSHPLHATMQPLAPPSLSHPAFMAPSTSASSSSTGSGRTGPPWVPLATKAYFKALGGYTIRGSDPGPDIHAFTGWIPERLSLREGFQREKEWRRIHSAWNAGQVLVTLGTGKTVVNGLVAYHAYGVIGIAETQEGERLLEVVDPGSTPRQTDGVLEESMGRLGLNGNGPEAEGDRGYLTMTWDRVCTEFEAISYNWDPALWPSTAVRHWSWPKPRSDDSIVEQESLDTSPRYRLSVRGGEPAEICILLSQHTNSKDRPLDDIALHVFEEQQQQQQQPSQRRVLSPNRVESSGQSPYSNGLHVLARFTPRQANTSLIVIPSRDRGLFARDFTVQALAPQGTTIELERIRATLPFSQTVQGQLSSRNAGGHPGNPSHMLNPQYKVVIADPAPGAGPSAAAGTHRGHGQLRMELQGDREIPWNVKLVYGNGARIFDLTEDAVVTDSGAYSYGMAYCDIADLRPGSYTAIISTFDPGITAPFNLTVESGSPVTVEPIPAEGAGLYSRTVQSKWTIEGGTAAGRPSAGSYSSNPMIELILPRPGHLLARLYLPDADTAGHPINLTIFKRGSEGALGEQVITTGPYISKLSGVAVPRTKVDKGIYVCVPSTYEPGVEVGWTINIWSDTALSADLL